MPFGSKGYSHVFFRGHGLSGFEKSSLNTTAGIMPRDGWLTVNVGEALEDEGWLYIQVTAEKSQG
mgnify:CR=1 FL=1